MELSKKDIEMLDHFFLFEGMKEEKRTIYQKLNVQKFSSGETIYTENQFHQALGIVLTGECVVYNHQTELNRILPGKCFGAAAIFADSEYVTTIRTQRSSKIAFITSDDLKDLFYQYPQMAIAYIEFLSNRILFLNRRIDSFTAPTSEEALMDYLKNHASEEGVVTVEGGFARLSRELSMGRATLYRVLGKLQETGVIQKDGNQILLCHFPRE